jgi:SAM-dependent methyltransferase
MVVVPSTRDLNSEFRDNNNRQYAYDFDSTIRKCLLDRVARFIAKDDAVLEIGAFKGEMTQQILDRYPNLTVLEGSSDLCVGLEERFGGQIELICASIETTSLERQFDVIFLVHTLEHLDDPVAALTLIASWLAPGGRLVVAVPNGLALSRQIAVRMGLIESNCAVTEGEYLHGHRRTYDLDVLRRDVLSAGLIVSEWGGVVVKPLSNGQFDQALAAGIISPTYVEACESLARDHPNLTATIFVVAVAPH